MTRWVLRNAHQYHIDPANIAIQGDSAGAIMAAAVAHSLAGEYQIDSTTPKLKMMILMTPLLQGLDLNLPSYKHNEDIFTGVMSKLLVAKFWIWYMGLDSDDLVTAVLQGKHLPDDFKLSDRFQRIIGHDLLPNAFKNGTPTTTNWTESDNSSIVEQISPFFLNPKFSPFMEENISSHHPLTMIVTSGFDILRDDGVMYTNRLRRAGVKVWWRHFEKGFHSCIAFWQGALKLEVAHQIHRETFGLVREYLHDELIDNVPEDRLYS